MAGLKHIERSIASYIAKNYHNVAEIGVGLNPETALMLHDCGVRVFCTDIRPFPSIPGVRIVYDDIFAPDVALYMGLDLIYSIRPHEEMMPALVALARKIDCDLLVYHLGFEGFQNGGELVDCGVILHRYFRSQNPSNRVL
ncbi:MAG TPA: UPF0146 family protein [Methanolinea sp.]|nr:UPF0146 family protein [Methanolinea sp.]HQK55524.1 UPF0146 family protein [Methanolinea sp.]